MKIDSPHVEFERIADIIEGRLTDDRRAASLAHISACSRCSEAMKEIEDVIHTMRTDASEDAPGYAVTAALHAFRSKIKSEPSGLTRVLAALNFDSFTLAPQFGLRSSLQSERQLIFSAGDNELQLQISPAGEEWTVAGQILGPCSGGQVEMRGTDFTVQTDLNALCEFALPPVSSGSYTLTLQMAEVELYISDLRLGDPG